VNAQPSTFALFDNNLDAPDTRGTWLLTELRESVVCRHTDDWQATLLRLEEAARNGAWVALAATYELGYLIEPRLQPLLPTNGSPLLTGWIFERGEWLSDDACDAWLTARATTVAGGTSQLEAHILENEYLACISRVRKYIEEGDCYQVNFTFPCQVARLAIPPVFTGRSAEPNRYATVRSSAIPAASSCRDRPNSSWSAEETP
jgi:para-aminobenzoate synthetase/4-amino-4-deoxychorismate lyase